MNITEIQYIERALEILRKEDLNFADQIRVLRTIAQICNRAAEVLEIREDENIDLAKVGEVGLTGKS